MKFVIVNGHMGNLGAISATLREIAGMDKMPFVCACHSGKIYPKGFKSPIEFPGEHADEKETSRMLWIRPELVRKDRLTDNPLGRIKIPELSGVEFVRPWHLYVPESAGGETRKATAVKGQTEIEAAAQALADLLVGLSKAPFNERFPYE